MEMRKMIELICQQSQDVGENKIAISFNDSVEFARPKSPAKVVGNKAQ